MKLRNSVKLLICLLFIVAGLVLVRISMSNAFSVDGIALANLEVKIATLDRQNMLDRETLYAKTSYTAIASAAASNGFVEEKSQISLTSSSNLAIKQ